jgi:hypothetical protein
MSYLNSIVSCLSTGAAPARPCLLPIQYPSLFLDVFQLAFSILLFGSFNKKENRSEHEKRQKARGGCQKRWDRAQDQRHTNEASLQEIQPRPRMLIYGTMHERRIAG